MTWTRLSDTFNSDPRQMRLSDAAFRLHVRALVWSNQMLTDGVVPADALVMFTRHPNPEFLVAELVKVGLWEDVDGEDSWQIDWTDQLDAEEVLYQRDRRAAKQKAYRERKAHHEAGDHTLCDPTKCPDLKRRVTGNKTGNGTGNVTGRVTGSRPVPSRPPTGTGTGDVDAPEGARVAAPTSDSSPTCLVCSKTETACRAIAAKGLPDSHEFTTISDLVAEVVTVSNGRASGAANDKRGGREFRLPPGSEPFKSRRGTRKTG